jgi:hypothetical protein
MDWAPYGMHLPIFVWFHDAPTEDRLERVIERLCNHADAALLAGKATQTQYDAWQVALNNWSKTIKTVG